DLQGCRILANDSVRFNRFQVISCRTLWHRNIVLLGDAAHTTHFSQGFGTMFAFDDALSLYSAIQQSSGIAPALRAYEDLQQPKIATFQETANASMHWSEDLLEAAGAANEIRVMELIEARWPNNAVPAGPLVQSQIRHSLTENPC